MPTAKQDKTRKNGLTVKDLIVMGVFGALLMVCSMIGGVLFAVTPTLTFYFSIGAALLPGPVFLLLLAKVPKRWGLTIIGVIISLLIGYYDCGDGTYSMVEWTCWVQTVEKTI